MQDPLNPLINQERFTRDLIETYKELPVLWDKNHPHYRNRAERNEAQDVLLLKCRDHYPETDEDFVKMKIDSLRSSFRKEWNKVRLSKASAKKPEDVHKPSLWYYNLLLFTVGEECLEDEEPIDMARVYWPREYSTMLIGLLKKHTCLYINNPASTLAKRNAAIKRITDEMNTYTGKKFAPHHIRKKIQLLKGQYRFECKKIRDSRRNNPRKPYRPNLWCFGMLNYLKEHVFQKTSLLKSDSRKLRRNIEETEVTANSDEEIQEVKEEVQSEQDEEPFEIFPDSNNVVAEPLVVNDNYDDIFDTIGKNVAYKLREMTDDQRKYAEHLINEVMYQGLMEDLTPNSRLSLNGT